MEFFTFPFKFRNISSYQTYPLDDESLCQISSWIYLIWLDFVGFLHLSSGISKNLILADVYNKEWKILWFGEIMRNVFTKFTLSSRVNLVNSTEQIIRVKFQVSSYSGLCRPPSEKFPFCPFHYRFPKKLSYQPSKMEDGPTCHIWSSYLQGFWVSFFNLLCHFSYEFLKIHY